MTVDVFMDVVIESYDTSFDVFESLIKLISARLVPLSCIKILALGIA